MIKFTEDVWDTPPLIIETDTVEDLLKNKELLDLCGGPSEKFKQFSIKYHSGWSKYKNNRHRAFLRKQFEMEPVLIAEFEDGSYTWLGKIEGCEEFDLPPFVKSK